MPPASGPVLITGASTGIGRATALHLDSLGFRVFAGVRKESDGESVRAKASDRLSPVIIDVAKGDSIARAAEEVIEAVGDRGLAGLVNNAGIGVGGPLEFLDLDELRRQLEVNVVGQVAVTQAFLPALRQARGRVVFTGSIGGRMAFPFIGPYNASKHALEAIASSLRQELKPWGIAVSIIEPGTIATNIWEKAEDYTRQALAALPPRGKELYGDRLEGASAATEKLSRSGIPPLEVAKVIEHALTAGRPRPRYLVGRDAKAQLVLSRALPQRVWDAIVARQLGG